MTELGYFKELAKNLNKERAIAIKALNEIEQTLRNAKPIEEAVIAYGIAVEALLEIDEWEE